MYKLFTRTTLVTTCAVFAFAQAPQTPQATPQNDKTAPAQGTLNSPPTTSTPTGSAAGSAAGSTAGQTTSSPAGSAASAAAGSTTAGAQSYRGVLLDASCSAVASRPMQSSTTGSQLSADATRNRETASSATGAAGAAATANSGGIAATRNTTADTTGANTAQAGQATAQAGTQSASAGTSAGGLTTYNGTGDRNRTVAASDSAGGDWTSVREKYKDCKVTPTTSSFAIMSNGQLYMIDDTSGALRQRMTTSPATATSDFQTMTLMGTPQGDRISVTSVQ